MIRMNDWVVVCPTGYTCIGYEGENKVRRFEIEVDDPMWVFALDVKKKDTEETFTIPMTVAENVAGFDITDNIRFVKGEYSGQIVGMKPDGAVKKSNKFTFYVAESINADNMITPSEGMEGVFIVIPSTAKIGQTIAVKTVDENGKPIEWEAIDPADSRTGATFTPSVSEDGVLSWTNNRNLENPEPVNIKGATGSQGEKGEKGDKGDKGEKGDKGDQGIQGETGATGSKGDPFTYNDFTPEQLAALKGEKGDKGETGSQGIQGVKGDTGAKGDKGDSGADGKDGVSVRHSWNGTTLTITSASGTTSANLKGEKGETGDTGATGEKGEKGDPFTYADFTPEQLSSLKGDKGDKGDQGEKGETGADGANGKDGTSVTHSWNGTTLIVTSASGTTSADLKGAKGDQGIQGVQGEKGDKGDKGDTGLQGEKGDTGAAGHTPVKGTDYWTAADKIEIVNSVLAALPTAEGVSF